MRHSPFREERKGSWSSIERDERTVFTSLSEREEQLQKPLKSLGQRKRSAKPRTIEQRSRKKPRPKVFDYPLQKRAAPPSKVIKTIDHDFDDRSRKRLEQGIFFDSERRGSQSVKKTRRAAPAPASRHSPPRKTQKPTPAPTKSKKVVRQPRRVSPGGGKRRKPGVPHPFKAKGRDIKIGQTPFFPLNVAEYGDGVMREVERPHSNLRPALVPLVDEESSSFRLDDELQISHVSQYSQRSQRS